MKRRESNTFKMVKVDSENDNNLRFVNQGSKTRRIVKIDIKPQRNFRM
jgi:hypothetical protein